MRASILIFGWAGLEAALLGIAGLGDLRSRAEAFLWLAGIMSLLYLGLVWCARRTINSARRMPSGLLGLILAGGVAFRLTLFGLTPALSDDARRYLWDDRVQLAGINPYRFAPDDPALAPLRDASWPGINHPNIPTIYPPLTQAAFRLGAWAWPTVMGQKAVFCLLEIGALGLIPYAWHPLVIIEVAGSGHNDPLGIVWLLAGLILWSARRRAWATAAFALSFLSKFATVILWPFYLIRARRLLAVFAGIVALGGVSCLSSPHLAPGLGHDAGAWEFNSSFYGVAAASIRCA